MLKIFWGSCSYSISATEDKYHPGYFGKVGMRNFHLIKHGKARNAKLILLYRFRGLGV